MYIIYHCSIVNMAIQKDKIESSSQIFFPFFFLFQKMVNFFGAQKSMVGPKTMPKDRRFDIL